MDSQFHDLIQPSWPFYSIINSTVDFDLMDMDVHVNSCDFSSSFSTPEDANTASDISSVPCLSSSFPDEFAESDPACSEDQLQALSVDDFLLDDGDMEFGISESEDSFLTSNQREELWSPSSSIKSNEAPSMESTPNQPSSLILPGEESVLDNRSVVLILLKAFGEAIGNRQNGLGDVILRCLSGKVSLSDEPLLRLAFNLCQEFEKHGDYLKQESFKNFDAAFRAFYQIFPYGRFAHFGANSAILEAMPADAETIIIVDFDMREGVQWPPILETLARLRKAVILISMKRENEKSDQAPSMWSFEESKRRLVDHGRLLGLRLKVEEMEIQDLVSEIKKTKKRGGRKEWLAFNCMTGLPHSGRARSRKQVDEFVRVAKDLMASNKGIITCGEGEACETLKHCSDFASFFQGNLGHYQALMESIEMNFPAHLAQAKMALESLFVTPFISTKAWFQKWVEMKESCNLPTGAGLESWRISRESLEEAREMVKGMQSLYEVRIGGESNNEMILQWKGTPLIRVSAWRS